MELSVCYQITNEGTREVSVARFRSSVLEVQQELSTYPQVECPLKHHFAPGAYAREILLPAGSIVIGKIHKHAHVNVISKGSVTVVTEAGRKDLFAPLTFVSEPGTKRVVIAHEDTVWTTVHMCGETDLEKIENYVIAKDYEELTMLEARKLLESA